MRRVPYSIKGAGRGLAAALLVAVIAALAPAPALAQMPTGTRVPIWLNWNSARAENVTTRVFLPAFERIRIEGYLFANPHPGAVPVKTFYHDGRDDYALVATAKGEADMVAAGYRFVRTEGYGFAQPFPTAVPLKLYWNASRTDYATVAEARSEQDQKNSGYSYVRVEAYLFPANDPDFGIRQFSVPVKKPDTTTVYLATKTAFVMHEDIAGNGCRYTWIGTTGGHPHDVVLTICDSGVVGTIVYEGQLMEVNPFQINREELFDWRVPPAHLTPTGTIIDVGIGYSPAVQQEYGAMAAAYGLSTLPRVYIAAYQQLAIDHANAVLGASGARTTLRLARTKMLTIFEDAFSSTADALGKIAERGISTPCSNGSDPYRAKAFRDFTGADLVSVWLGNRPAGFNNGEAWVGPSTIWCDDKLAFSVVWGADAVLGGYAFVHEIGHNLGVIHGHGEPNGYVDWDLFQDYGYGHVDAGNGFRDVMAYGNICKPDENACPPLPYFSTPHVRIEPSTKVRVVTGGAPMGSSSSAHSAYRISQRSAAVAGYRTLKCPGTMQTCGGGSGDGSGGGTSPMPDPESPPVQVE